MIMLISQIGVKKQNKMKKNMKYEVKKKLPLKNYFNFLNLHPFP